MAAGMLRDMYNERERRRYLMRRLRRKLALWCFITLIGVCAAGASLGADLLISWLYSLRLSLPAHLSTSPLLGRAVWTVLLSMLSHACVRACPEAAGSGIPELKLILSASPTDSMLAYLSLRTAVAKFVGLVFAKSAGLSIGREGPFVHISCCIAMLLAPPMLKADTSMLSAVLRAASAAGVSFSFGAPIGGLLFAAEVSVTYFRVSHLPHALLCALSGLLAVSWVNYGSLAPFHSQDVKPARMISPLETATIVGLGLVCGALAVGFNLAVRELLQLRSELLVTYRSELVAVLSVAVLTTLVTCSYSPLHLLELPPAQLVPRILAGLMTPEEAAAAEAASGGAGSVPPPVTEPLLTGHWRALGWLTACLAKLVITALTIVLPIPCGMFIPTFVAGGLAGLCWGELAQLMPLATDRDPAAFALLGAAALTGSVTGTISTAVIALELTGLGASEATPLTLCCVFANALRGLYCPSVYDIIARHRHLAGHVLLTRRTTTQGWQNAGSGVLVHARAEDIVSTLSNGLPIPVLHELTPLGELAAAASACCAGGVVRVPVVRQLSAASAAAGGGAVAHAEGHNPPPSPVPPPVETRARDPHRQRLLGSIDAHRLRAYCTAVARAGGLEPSAPGDGEPTPEQLLEGVNLFSAHDRHGRLLDTTPFVVHPDLAMRHVVNIFQMLDAAQLFVVSGERYVGTITKEGISLLLAQSLGETGSISRDLSRARNNSIIAHAVDDDGVTGPQHVDGGSSAAARSLLAVPLLTGSAERRGEVSAVRDRV